jgi:NAD(P)-dependent dehydrogenase (short-subunit alcohol dehydrogenase family)
MSRQLQDRVIVIIGGTTGIGRSGARACVAAGASVVVVGRNRDNCERAEQELGPQCVSLCGDATRRATAIEAIALARDTFGRFDGLYHVAGGSGRIMGDGPLEEIRDDGWQVTIELNLSSVFYSNRAAVRQFLQQGSGGSIVNVSSVLGFSPSPRFFATHAYATAKAGIIGLTKSAAAFYAGKNIRFNALAPALVDTPMAARAASDDAIMKYVKTKQPLDGGRIGRPEDLDAALVLLLSDASRFVTGQVLTIDGGWTVTEGQYQDEG